MRDKFLNEEGLMIYECLNEDDEWKHDVNEWMDGWIDGWIDGWREGWMDGWMDG